jgi:hypothetical protein
MTTSKEEQQQPISEASYSNEDQKLIVSLLDEYSKKLLNVCHQINKFGLRSVIGLSLSLFMYLFLFTGEIFSLFLARSSRSSEDEFPLRLIIFLLLPGLLTAFFKIIKRDMKLLVRDASVLSLKLEKVIRVASQVQEHSLSNFVSQLELDLRLTDAELALQHYTDLLKTTKRSFFRFFV